MSEGRLPPPRAISRERLAPTSQLASTSSWSQGNSETVTAYDELWYTGRPKLP